MVSQAGVGAEVCGGVGALSGGLCVKADAGKRDGADGLTQLAPLNAGADSIHRSVQSLFVRVGVSTCVCLPVCVVTCE